MATVSGEVVFETRLSSTMLALDSQGVLRFFDREDMALEHSDCGDTQSVLYGLDVATSDTLREQRAVAPRPDPYDSLVDRAPYLRAVEPEMSALGAVRRDGLRLR
jgi:hypothetical protein